MLLIFNIITTSRKVNFFPCIFQMSCVVVFIYELISDVTLFKIVKTFFIKISGKTHDHFSRESSIVCKNLLNHYVPPLAQR